MTTIWCSLEQAASRDADHLLDATDAVDLIFQLLRQQPLDFLRRGANPKCGYECCVKGDVGKHVHWNPTGRLHTSDQNDDENEVDEYDLPN